MDCDNGMSAKAEAGASREARWPFAAGPLAVAVALLGGVGALAAQPDWAGDPDTTRQLFLFTSNAITAQPETVQNPYGSPWADVVVVEPAGTGWQDPQRQFTTPGVNEDGAWDIGPGGTITLGLPFAPPLGDPGLSYRIEFHVRLVAYEIPVAMPVITAPGLQLENVTSSVVTVKQDTLGRYREVTWTAAADVPAGNSASLLFTATSQGAVIDDIDVYTRYTVVGEPLHSFSGWIAQAYPGQSDPAVVGFHAVPDGDGIPNGLKYYLGQQPGIFAVPISIVSADATTFIFTHTRNRQDTPDVTGRYEWSLDLSNWLQDGESLGDISTSFAPALIDDSHPDFKVIEVTATTVGNDHRRIFARLRVAQVEPAN